MQQRRPTLNKKMQKSMPKQELYRKRTGHRERTHFRLNGYGWPLVTEKVTRKNEEEPVIKKKTF